MHLLLAALISSAPAAPVPKLPPDLALVPADATGFATIRMQDVLKSKAFVPALKVGDAITWPDMPLLTEEHSANRCVRATVIWPVPDPHPGAGAFGIPGRVVGPVYLLTFDVPLPPPFGTGPEVVAAFAKMTPKQQEEYRQSVRERDGLRISEDQDGWTNFFALNDRTLVVGSRASVDWLLDRRAKPMAGPFSAALNAAVEAHGVVAVRPGRYREKFTKQGPEWSKALGTAWDAEVLTATLTSTTDVKLKFDLTFANDSKAKAGAGDLAAAWAGVIGTDLRGLTDEVVRQGERENAQPDPNNADGTTNALRAAVTALGKGWAVEGDTASLAVTLEHFGPIVWPVLGRVTPVGMPKMYAYPGPKADERVAKAVLAYRDKHGTYPPAHYPTKDGKPGLSWRVAILPFLGADAAALYAKFKLDEPWNSPTNKPLLQEMPLVFCDAAETIGASDYPPRPRTTYRLFVGPGTLFEGPKGVPAKSVTDPVGDTILLVSTTDAMTPWTRPDEFEVKGETLTAENDFWQPEHVWCVMADGTRKALATKDRKAFLAALTRAGQETIKPEAMSLSPPQYFPNDK